MKFITPMSEVQGWYGCENHQLIVKFTAYRFFHGGWQITPWSEYWIYLGHSGNILPADIGRPLTIKYLFILFWNSQTIRWLVARTVVIEKTKREKRYAPEKWSRTDSLSAIRASAMKLYSNIHTWDSVWAMVFSRPLKPVGVLFSKLHRTTERTI